MTEFSVTYRGAAPIASAFVRSLERAGLSVSWDRPSEERGVSEFALGVAVGIAANGSYDALKAGVEHFVAGRLGGRATVEATSTEPPPTGSIDLVLLSEGPRAGEVQRIDPSGADQLFYDYPTRALYRRSQPCLYRPTPKGLACVYVYAGEAIRPVE